MKPILASRVLASRVLASVVLAYVVLASALLAQGDLPHPHGMDYGPFVCATWEARWPRGNVALKGIANRLADSLAIGQPPTWLGRHWPPPAALCRHPV